MLERGWPIWRSSGAPGDPSRRRASGHPAHRPLRRRDRAHPFSRSSRPSVSRTGSRPVSCNMASYAGKRRNWRRPSRNRPRCSRWACYSRKRWMLRTSPRSHAGPAFPSASCWRARSRSCCAWRPVTAGSWVRDEAIRGGQRRAARAGLYMRDPNRPIGSFIFLGPTGVGKTELGAGREFLFDDEQAMGAHRHERVPERHTVSRLVGAARLRLLRKAASSPRQCGACSTPVVLFDEIEKAHPRSSTRFAGAGRRPADRRPWPHRGLQEHGGDHDQQWGSEAQVAGGG